MIRKIGCATAAVIALAVACVPAMPHRPGIPNGDLIGASTGQVGPFVIPSSWKQATWFVDPANTSTCASDNNRTCSLGTCGTAGDGPCATFGSIVSRWGTLSPRIAQNTVLAILSSATTDADPWYLGPYYLENGASFLVQGLPTTVTTTTLAAVTSKARASNQALLATFASCSGFAPGMMLTNTTHSSRAWLYKQISGCQWMITQPGTLVNESAPAAGVPCTFPFPKVDTWATSDSITVATVPLVNAATMSVVIQEQSNSTFANTLLFYNAGVRAQTNGDGHSIVTIGGGVEFIESYSALPVEFTAVPSSGAGNQNNGAINSALAGGIVASPGGVLGITTTASGDVTPQTCLSSGYVGTGTTFIIQPNQAEFTGDVLLATGYHNRIGVNFATFGYVYLDASELDVFGAAYFTPVAEIGGVSPVLYGNGTLNVVGGGKAFYPSGAGGAGTAFPLSGGWLLNAQTKACLGVPSVALPTLTCNLTASPSIADANLGATQGCLWVEGAASICNLAY